MPQDFAPGTVLKGIDHNNLKRRLIVKKHKKGYIYKDPINVTCPNKEYDSADGIDSWFEKGWVVEPSAGQKVPGEGGE